MCKKSIPWVKGSNFADSQKRCCRSKATQRNMQANYSMHACLQTQIHASIDAYRQACMQTFMHATYIHTSIRPYNQAPIHPPSIYTHLHIYIHRSTDQSIHASIHLSMHPHTRTSIHPQTCILTSIMACCISDHPQPARPQHENHLLMACSTCIESTLNRHIPLLTPPGHWPMECQTIRTLRWHILPHTSQSIVRSLR